MDAPIVVLGSRTRAGRPGAVLARRLDKAAALAGVLSGPVVVTGRGEARVMERYLVERGVDKRRIVVEDAATSTNENLENARALFPQESPFHVVTSDFHILRTALWAWHLGIPVRLHGAGTPWEAKARNYLREVLATPHSMARVLWRKLRG